MFSDAWISAWIIKVQKSNKLLTINFGLSFDIEGFVSFYTTVLAHFKAVL